MDKILVSGLEFHAHAGVTEAERQTGQRCSLDLEIVTDLRKAGESDNLADAIDYSAVCGAVLEVGTTRRFALVEALAEAVAATILEKFPHAEEVMVRAKKLQPPVSAIRDYFAVEIRRTRQDAARARQDSRK
jgi:dihydroneopterin aldolase